PVAPSSRERRRHSVGAAPSWPPTTVCAADSLDSATVSPPHWTASTSQAAGGWCASWSRRSASPAGESRSTSRSRSRTSHHPTNTDPTTGHLARTPPRDRLGQSHRQAMCACVPIVELSREGISLIVIQRQLGHYAGDRVKRAARTRFVDGCEASERDAVRRL